MRILEQRLDLLIHAHDVQGLGHVSRSVAIGLAVRRLAPELRVLLVTGCQEVGALIGRAPLDWVKLPSYKSVVESGRAKPQRGNTNLSFSETVALRSKILETWIPLLQPRCILVDNRPMGQWNELLSVLKSPYCLNISWILGMRAFIGNVTGVWTEEAAAIFKEHYSGLLWYGDTKVHGSLPKRELEDHFKTSVYETGFVSRAQELKQWEDLVTSSFDQLVGTVAFSWCSYETLNILESLLETLKCFDKGMGAWSIFVGSGCESERKNRILHSLQQLLFCSVEAISDRYLTALQSSAVALVYAGYNTLTDLLWARTPAVAIIRGVVSREQEMHTKKLAAQVGSSIRFLKEEEVSTEVLYTALQEQMCKSRQITNINLGGAQVTAHYLIETIYQQAYSRRNDRQYLG